MILEVLEEAWATSPARVIAAVLLTPPAVYVGWKALGVLFILGGASW